MAITSSKMIQIGHMRCFLTSTKNVNVKKHLICPIWIIFEKVIAILNFASKFFTSYRRAADRILDFFCPKLVKYQILAKVILVVLNSKPS